MNSTNEPVIINLGNRPPAPGLSGTMVELTQKLWLTAEGDKAVVDGDPRAKILLGLPGDPIPLEQAVSLGLVDEDDDTEDEAPAEKMTSPSKNKQRQPAQNK